MKRIKITLPEGGHRVTSDTAFPVRPGFVYEIEAEEIIIEGDAKVNQAPAQRIPFDLEAAKAGAQVLWGDTPVRWLGLGNVSSSVGAHNIIEHPQGLAYAPDKDLFMAPRKPRVRYLNLRAEDKDLRGPVESIHFPTKEEAEEFAGMFDRNSWALIAYPITIE